MPTSRIAPTPVSDVHVCCITLHNFRLFSGWQEVRLDGPTSPSARGVLPQLQGTHRNTVLQALLLAFCGVEAEGIAFPTASASDRAAAYRHFLDDTVSRGLDPTYARRMGIDVALIVDDRPAAVARTWMLGGGRSTVVTEVLRVSYGDERSQVTCTGPTNAGAHQLQQHVEWLGSGLRLGARPIPAQRRPRHDVLTTSRRRPALLGTGQP